MMRPVSVIEGRAIPWGAKNVDTDLIIPARWLKTISRIGMGVGAFEGLRADPANVFDAPANAGAPILIAGDNFGCGSSREHAAWALLDMGVRAVIAPSFSDIFASNAFKNGLLTVELPQAGIDWLLLVANSEPISIDLESDAVTTLGGDRFTFSLDAFRKSCLLGGLDEIGLTMAMADRIGAYEAAAAVRSPWVVPAGAAA